MLSSERARAEAVSSKVQEAYVAASRLPVLGDNEAPETTTTTPNDNERKGIFNSICISPLASSKARTGTTPPGLNLKDTQSLDAVCLAERVDYLMQEDDSSVLLRLASNTTPAFREDEKKEDGNLPALQLLPVIGGQEAESGEAGFAPPQLGMRSGSESTTEIVSIDSKLGKTSGRKSASAYPMHPPYPPQDRDSSMPYYYPMGGRMPPDMPPGGNMRVGVVGGPPPKGSSPSRPGMGSSQHPMPPPYPAYPPPPPPQGMYSQYGPPPPMGYNPYQGYYPHPLPRHMQPMYIAQQQQQLPPVNDVLLPVKKGETLNSKAGTKRGRSPALLDSNTTKKPKPVSSSKRKKNTCPQEREKAAASVHAVNMASGGKNDRAAARAAAIFRGVTMRTSGKWQAQLYFAGKSRYIGVFDTREKAALAHEIARENLKKAGSQSGPKDSIEKSTESMVNVARIAALEGVNERIE
jgi:hypothetical protein